MASQSLFRVAVTALAASSIEYYDFFIYGTAAAIIFPTIFFSSDLSPVVAQLAAFGTFAVGFLARPLGGIVFGHFGDLFGRKRALVIALAVMGLATTAVGLLPSYAQVGVWAPIALVTLRFLQGFAVGGQWGGAALLAIESASKEKRGFYGSFVQIGVPVGLLLANGIFAIISAVLSPEAFQAWGWRIPFLLSIGLVLLGLYVQKQLEESHEFAATMQSSEKQSGGMKNRRSPLIDALRGHSKTIVLAGGSYIASNGCFYMTIVYAVSYGTLTLHIPNATLLTGTMIGSLCFAPALMYFAALSDRVSRTGLFMLGCVCTGLFSLAFFPMIETQSAVMIALAMIGAQVFGAMMYGPQAAMFAELFPAEVRYSGVSLSYQIGAVLGGGFAPIIATVLFAEFQSSLALGIYMFLMCMISLICTALLAKRAGQAATRTHVTTG